jgi:HEAT repeat protein
MPIQEMMTTENGHQENRRKDFESVLRDLLKTVKVICTYPAGNPLPQSVRRSFCEKLVGTIRQHGEVIIDVEQGQLLLDDQPVFVDRSKEERLAGLFFDSGVTGIKIDGAIDEAQVSSFLNVMAEHYASGRKAEDLVAMLWQARLSAFAFDTLEDVTLREYDDSFDINEYLESGGVGKRIFRRFEEDETEDYESIFSEGVEQGEIDLDDDGTGTAEQVGKTMAFHSAGGAKAAGQPLDTTVILNDEFELTSQEETIIGEILERDARFDFGRSTIELLKEILAQETEFHEFNESVIICEKVHTELVEAGALPFAGELLAYLKLLQGQYDKARPQWSERLKEAYIAIGSRDRLAVLAKALNDHPEVTDEELEGYLDTFGWEALAGMTDLLGDLDHMSHRLCLRDYLTERGRSNIDIVSRGIFDKRWYVVRNSVTILARIGDHRAISYLKKVAKHYEPRVRQELVNSLKDCPNDQALDILQVLVTDMEADIRHAAINTILERRNPAAFKAIAEIIDDEDFGRIDRPDRSELLRAYSLLGGIEAVPYLKDMATKANPLRDEDQNFMRQAAFEALAVNPGQEAEEVLSKLSRSWRPDLRRRASEALDQRRRKALGGV